MSKERKIRREKKEKTERKKIMVYAIISVTILILLGIAAAYAYFRMNVQSVESLTNITATLDCMKVEFVEEGNVGLANLDYDYPITDEYALQNVVPITIRVVNNCTNNLEGVDYTLALTTLSSNPSGSEDKGYIPDNKIRYKVLRKLGSSNETTLHNNNYLSNNERIKEGRVLDYLKQDLNNREVTKSYDNKTIYKIDSNTIDNEEVYIYKIYLWIDYYEGDSKMYDSNNTEPHDSSYDNQTQGQRFKASVSLIINATAEGINVPYQAPTPGYKGVQIVSGDLDTVGSVVKIANEEFYVIGKEGDNVKLLAKWNLKVGGVYNVNTLQSTYASSDEGYGLQDENMKGIEYANGSAQTMRYGTVAFSRSYWSNESSYPAYVYNSNASIKTYVDDYVSYLNTQGVNVSGRLIQQEELVALGCNASSNTCASAPTWLYQTTYWSGSAGSSSDIWAVYSDNFFRYYDSSSNANIFGVRPVIILTPEIDYKTFEYIAEYTGEEETVKLPYAGKYKIEAWGAEGGKYNDTYKAGYGAYSVGVLNVKDDDSTTVYINVGGQPAGNTAVNKTIEGGYNGGGKSNARSDIVSNAGGGASSVALVSGELKELSSHSTDGKIIIVAGGGGGSSYYTTARYGIGGNAGGIRGNDGTTSAPTNTCETYGYGATQTGAGSTYIPSNHTTLVPSLVPASFGLGGDGALSTVGGSGGGAGYYGGGGTSCIGGGGGGSSYIASKNLISFGEVEKHMTCYDCSTSSNANTKTISNQCVSTTPSADCSKAGNGYVKITLIK